MQDYLNTLLQKYLRNECSAKEAEIVLDYLDTAEGQEQLSQIMEQDMADAEALPTAEDADADFEGLLHHMKQQIGSEAHPQPVMKKTYFWYRAAAAVTVLLLSGLAVFLFFSNRLIVQQTAYGETKKVTLEDGTLITLNANSTLKYARDYRQKREVWLEGEAFFEVEPLAADAAASGQPPALVKFTVHTDRLAVEVTGTSFNVSDREDKTQVVLNSGSIQLKTQGADAVAMSPGDMVEVRGGQKQVIRKVVDPEVYNAWKDNRMVCDDTPLHVIAQAIRHNYGMQMIFSDTTLAGMVVTGTLPTDRLELLLQVLSESMDLQIEQNEHTIFVRKPEE